MKHINIFLVRLHGEYNISLSFLYVCMVNTIYLFSFVEDEDPNLRIESSAIINLRGVSTKLNKYKGPHRPDAIW